MDSRECEKWTLPLHRHGLCNYSSFFVIYSAVLGFNRGRIWEHKVMELG